jgi:cytochrome c oxidase cbb3-type subunit 3
MRTLALAVVFSALTVALRAGQAPVFPAGTQGRGGAGRGALPPPPPPDPAAIARGREVLTRNCSACHGPDGRGGPDGAGDLSKSPMAIANDGGRQLREFLAVGRPERRMPGFSMPEAEVADLSAYFRSLAPPAAAGRGPGGRGGPIPVTVLGDANAGDAYFKSAGCTKCHAAGGDLKGIGSRLPVASIQGRLVMPRGAGGYPRSFLSPPDATEASRTVIVTPASGTAIRGTLLWITDFWVTLVDEQGVRRTIARNGNVPKIEVNDPLAWHIDHMKTLTDKNMHDLTAYLVTLK